jgi:hypothetical protein
MFISQYCASNASLCHNDMALSGHKKMKPKKTRDEKKMISRIDSQKEQKLAFNI